MKLARVVALFAVAAFTPSLLFSFQGPPGCGQDCSSCHSFTKEDAGKLLKLDVTSVSKAPVSGLWEVIGSQNGRNVRVYVDYGKKYAVLINNFIPISSIRKPPAMKKVDVKSIPLSDSMVVGDPSAKNKIIVFSDPDCPFCRKLHPELKDIVKKRKDIAFYIKLFPLVKLHPQSYEKSKAIMCKKSNKVLDDAFEGKDIPKADCDTKVPDENMKLAEKLGISGTPTIILPDGRVIPGYVDAPSILMLLEASE